MHDVRRVARGHLRERLRVVLEEGELERRLGAVLAGLVVGPHPRRAIALRVVVAGPCEDLDRSARLGRRIEHALSAGSCGGRGSVAPRARRAGVRSAAAGGEEGSQAHAAGQSEKAFAIEIRIHVRLHVVETLSVTQRLRGCHFAVCWRDRRSAAVRDHPVVPLEIEVRDDLVEEAW